MDRQTKTGSAIPSATTAASAPAGPAGTRPGFPARLEAAHGKTSARPASQTAFAAAQDVLAGGVNSPVRAFQAVGGDPVFVRRGKAGRIQDLDGTWYTDFCQSWGAVILGHAHPGVVRAARSRTRLGSSFGMPTPGETRLAGLIRDAMPWMERLRFTSSGTEAVMSALRLARAWTGRDLVIKFDGCYHGHSDQLLVKAGSGLATLELQDGKENTSFSGGVPSQVASLTLSIPYNDPEALKACLQAHPGRIAAVIVEPVAANMGTVLPAPGYLTTLRALCSLHGSLLIFDEVITGFRLGPSGAAGLYGITPDLCTLGKIIGGGFPVGAYGGRAEIMALLAPGGPVYQAGTLSGNPVTMAAGVEVLTRLASGQMHKRVEELAGEFFTRLEAGLDPARTCLNHLGGMFTLFFRPGPVTDYAGAKESDTRAFARFYHHLLARGVYLGPAQYEAGFVGAGHTRRQLGRAAELIIQAAENVREDGTS